MALKQKNQTLPYYVVVSTVVMIFLLSSSNLGSNSSNGLQFWNTTVVSSSAALRLPSSGKLFCWVLTGEQYYNLRIPAVNTTWLKRCDHGEFFVKNPLNDSSIPFSTVFKDLKNDYYQLFHKSMAAFYYAYKGISSNFDWYFKVDDDTYVIVEHLKEFLSQFDHRKPFYLGFQFEQHGKYHSGGSGYVLSNAAVKILAEKGFTNRTACPYHRYEDVGIGQCLKNLGISPTKIPEAQNRFLPFSDIMEKYRDRNVISLHYQSPREMRKIEKFLYFVNSPQKSQFYKQQ